MAAHRGRHEAPDEPTDDQPSGYGAEPETGQVDSPQSASAVDPSGRTTGARLTPGPRSSTADAEADAPSPGAGGDAGTPTGGSDDGPAAADGGVDAAGTDGAASADSTASADAVREDVDGAHREATAAAKEAEQPEEAEEAEALAAEPDARPTPVHSGFAADLRDAIAPRTFLLVVGVLLLQLGFILSYVGAFHSPKPQDIPMAVVAPQQVSGQLVQQYNSAPGDPVQATAMSQAQAREQLRDGRTSAVLIVNPQSQQDTLLVASGGGSSVAEAVEAVVRQGQATQQRTVTVQDEIPLQPGDSRGLTGFYLVIGWLVGGYLMASLLGVAAGSRPANLRRAGFRLAASALYAIGSGLGGALIVDQLLNALTGHFMALWWLGALIVFSAATVTIAFQTLLGVVGIGVTVLIFVILGNPSAGGAYQAELLPPFWREISEALPNGAGTAAVRKIIYFGSHNIAGNIWVLAIWATAGLLVTLLGAGLLQRRARQRAERRAGTATRVAAAAA